MNILGFDTCWDACSVAVGRSADSAEPRVFDTFEAMQTGQAEQLVPAIDKAMSLAGLTFAELDGLFVTNGPGSFTGTRIGVAAARALSLAIGKPTIELSSLQLMALSPQIPEEDRHRDLVIACDARRDRIYLQVFSGQSREPVGSPVIASLEDVTGIVAGRAVIVAGSATAAVADLITSIDGDAHVITEHILPRARDGVALAARNLAAQRNDVPLSAPVPLYLRPPDAKPQMGKVLGRAP